jgi:hypothetical protein
MTTGFAVTIGLNGVDPGHYQGWTGASPDGEYDAFDLAALAKQAGFEARTLSTSGATREAVVGATREAADRLGPGDIFLFGFAGHGGQLPERDGDQGFEKTAVLYNGQLLESELHRLWARFAPGVRIIAIMDTCHAGTAAQLVPYGLVSSKGHITRGPAWQRFRAMPTRSAQRTYAANRAFYDDLAEQADPEAKPEIQATVLLLSACGEHQLAQGTLFTDKLLRVWGSGGFQGDYRSFCQTIAKRMPAFQTPGYRVLGAPNSAFELERPFTI